MFCNFEIAIGPRGWTFALFVLFAWLFGMNFGCASLIPREHERAMQTFRDTAATVATATPFKKTALRGRAQAHDPGMAMEFATIYRFKSYYAGVNGAMEFDVEGEGDRRPATITPAEEAAIASRFGDEVLEQARMDYDFALTLLQIIRGPAPAPAPASQPSNLSPDAGNMVEVAPR